MTYTSPAPSSRLIPEKWYNMAMERRSEQKTTVACNRRPFLSDSGCSRGDVDTNQFADFPYCESIWLGDPIIPPELTEVPMNIPVPPACACVNIKHKIDFKYSKKKKFEANASFSAVGDCCEGNYTTKVNLQIPCPVDKKGKNAGKIKVKIAYGNGKKSDSASFLRANADSCTIEPLAPEINLNLPCPVDSSIRSKIEVGIGWNTPNDIIYLVRQRTTTLGVTIQFANGTVIFRHYTDRTYDPPYIYRQDLEQVVGGKKLHMAFFRITGSGQWAFKFYKDSEYNIRGMNILIPGGWYLSGTDGSDSSSPGSSSSSSPVFIRFTGANGSGGMAIDNTASCRLDLSTNRIEINIPCPLPKKGSKMKFKIGYGSGPNSASAEILAAASSSCAMELLSPNIDLNIPCPVVYRLAPAIAAALRDAAWKNNLDDPDKGTVFAIAEDVMRRAAEIEGLVPSRIMDAENREKLRRNIRTELSRSYPRLAAMGLNNDDIAIESVVRYTGRRIRLNIKIGDNSYSTSASFIAIDSSRCTIEPLVPDLNLRIPCPVANKKNPRIKATVRYGSSSSSESDSYSYASVDPRSCVVNLKDIRLDLRIPCPVTNKKNPKIKATVRYGSSSSSESDSYSYASADSRSCVVNLKDIRLDLKIPCPVRKKNRKEGNPKIRVRYMKSPTESSCMSSSYVEIGSSSCEARFKTIVLDLRSIGGGGGGVIGDGPFYPVYDDSSSSSAEVSSLKECYWQYSGTTYKLADQTVPDGDGFLSLRACTTPDKIGQATLQVYPDLATLNTAQRDPQYYILPIYYIASGRITLDLRRMPLVFASELL